MGCSRGRVAHPHRRPVPHPASAGDRPLGRTCHRERTIHLVVAQRTSTVSGRPTGGWPGTTIGTTRCLGPERAPTSCRGTTLSPNGQITLNAHNLYLETLAELGPIGLGMLAVTLGLPLLALRPGGVTTVTGPCSPCLPCPRRHDWELGNAGGDTGRAWVCSGLAVARAKKRPWRKYRDAGAR